MQIATADELLAGGLHRRSLCSPSNRAAAGSQFEVMSKALGHGFAVSPRCLMDIAAVVRTDAVDRPAQLIEALADRRVLDPVAIGQYHARSIFGLHKPCKGSGAERHSVSRLTVHLVCVTKYRRKVRLTTLPLVIGSRAISERCAQAMDCELLACDGEVLITSICLSSIRPNILSRFWSTLSRERQAGCSGRSAPDIASRYRGRCAVVTLVFRCVNRRRHTGGR